jgi:hypothetical protein
MGAVMTLPPYYPPATEPRAAALHRIGRTINAFLADSLAAALLARQAMSPEEVSAGQPPQRMLLSGSQGTGKTSRALEFIARIKEPVTIHFYLPTLDKAEEAYRDYAKLTAGGGLPAMVVRGLGAPDPEQADVTMCPRAQAAQAVAERDISPRKSICRDCSLRPECGSMRQSRAIARLGGRGVYFMTHAYLHYPSPAPVADLAIVDECATIDAVELISLPIDEIISAAPLLVSGKAAAIDVPVLLGRLADALSAPDALTGLRLAGIGRAELSALRKAADRRSVPSIDGRMQDEAIQKAVEQTDIRQRQRLVVLFDALAREIDVPRRVLNGVSYDPDRRRVVVSSLRRPRGLDQTPLLLLDGTGDIELNRMLFGVMEHEVVRVERDATVIGTTSRQYSRQSLTGRDSQGRPIENRTDDAFQLRHEIAGLVRRTGAKTLLVATLRAEDALRADGVLPPDTKTAHFSALRGRNSHQHCEAVIVLGRESLSIIDAELRARAYMADDPEPFVSMAAAPPSDWKWKNQWPYRATFMRRMRDGTSMPVEVDVHPDPRVQRFIEQLREAEIIHAVDRVRPVLNRRRIIVLNQLVLDLTYDRVMTHAELIQGGDRIDQAWATAGVLPETPGDLMKAFPKLFGSEDTAKRAMKKSRWLNAGGTSGDSPWNARTALYRRENQRGKDARVRFASWVIDPRAALESLIGPVRNFRILPDDIGQQPQAAHRERQSRRDQRRVQHHKTATSPHRRSHQVQPIVAPGRNPPGHPHMTP